MGPAWGQRGVSVGSAWGQHRGSVGPPRGQHTGTPAKGMVTHPCRVWRGSHLVYKSDTDHNEFSTHMFLRGAATRNRLLEGGPATAYC